MVSLTKYMKKSRMSWILNGFGASSIPKRRPVYGPLDGKYGKFKNVMDVK